MEEIRSLLELHKVVAVTCNQWGDTGKGKFADLFAEFADIIVRGTGGDNAGHTICWKDELGETKELVTHLLPSGILYDSFGKHNIIGSGTVVNPRALIGEIESLKKMGLSYDYLRIALNAKLILPQHILVDRLKESSSGAGKIGTTGKGIGPAYVDHYNRTGLIMNHLLNPDIFVKKLRENLLDKTRLLKTYDPWLVENIFQQEYLESGIYYNAKNIFDVDAIIEKYLAYGKELKDLITDTDSFVRQAVGRLMILLEGAQGALLSIDHGTYPYVTASDCTVAGLAKGAGLNPEDVGLSLGIVKAPYITRVGGGPFPTEMGGDESEKWCNNGWSSRETEDENFFQASVNDAGEFSQGVAIRRAGNEYGKTTKRPRRTGWLDLVLLRHALIYSGPDTILTKVDVLNDCETIKICTAYKYVGPDYQYGSSILKTGCKIDEAIILSDVLEHCQPIYQEFPGWKQSLKGISTFGSLPSELRQIIDFISLETGMNPRIVSTGPERSETIFV